VTYPNLKEVIDDGREGSKEGQEVRLWMRKEINAQPNRLFFQFFVGFSKS
jgi:hypothetical protein